MNWNSAVAMTVGTWVKETGAATTGATPTGEILRRVETEAGFPSLFDVNAISAPPNLYFVLIIAYFVCSKTY
jgi:hypothetical protein